MTALKVRACGPATSIQDQGRTGWQRYGIARSGAADPLALATANALVGNAPGEAAIELALLGATLEAVASPVRLALAGAVMPLSIDGVRIADHTSFVLEQGATLTIGAARKGVFAILAIAGGLDIADELGSKSLHARARLGGWRGRPLAMGDEVPLRVAATASIVERTIETVELDSPLPFRAVLGPQDDHFTRDGLNTFLSAEYRVSAEADRMAYRLSGPRIEHSKGFNIVSDGVVPGSVQVPGTGEPIVLLPDCQTTGGYPKIATVIAPDLRLLAHCRPGASLKFAAIGNEEARAAALDHARKCAQIHDRIRLVRSGVPDAAALLEMNLAGAALSADDPDSWQR